MFADLRKLSPVIFFEKGAKENQLLEDLREWWDSYSLALNTDSDDLVLKTKEENAKDSTDNLLERVKKSYYSQNKISRRDKAK